MCWPVKNLGALQRERLAPWSDEYGKIVPANPETAKGRPNARVRRSAVVMFDHDLRRYEGAIVEWPSRDRAAARRVRRVPRDLPLRAFTESPEAETRGRRFTFRAPTRQLRRC